MLLILSIYAVLVWLIFFRFRWLAWNRTAQVMVGTIGLVICLVVVGLLNTKTPAGRVTVMGVVVEIAPAVGGTVREVNVVPNQPVEAGATLLRLDPRPFQFAVDDAEAAVEIAGQTLARQQEAFERSQGAAVSRQAIDESQATLDAAEARLADARYDLEQATVRAPADGIVTAVNLAPGDQARPLSPVMPLIRTDELLLVGVFSQNGLRAIEEGAEVQMAFDSAPGRLFASEIREILPGISGGQIPVSAELLSSANVGATSDLLVLLTWPDDLPKGSARLGMVGTATVFGEDAGAMGILAKVLLWVRMLGTYL